LEIEQSRHGAVTVLRPKGPVAEVDAEHFRREAAEAIGESLGRCVVDAQEIAFVDSVGLEALLDVTERLATAGQSLKLCGATETLREILDVTGLSGEFEHYEDVPTAVRSFL
jgi:Anti-anti-sigma regulatory factor (antagonist of anti-sigma factor)